MEKYMQEIDKYVQGYYSNAKKGGVLLIEGEPGTGKTALIHQYRSAIK